MTKAIGEQLTILDTIHSLCMDAGIGRIDYFTALSQIDALCFKELGDKLGTNKSDEFTRAIRTAKWMIEKEDTRVAKAVKQEDWREAATLATYRDGMSQILTVFEIAADRIKSAKTGSNSVNIHEGAGGDTGSTNKE